MAQLSEPVAENASNETETNVESEPVNPPQQDNQAEAIKFIKTKLTSAFDEQKLNTRTHIHLLHCV